MTHTPRLVVGISGASGAIYGVRLLHALGRLGIERHLIVSPSAEMTLTHELGMTRADVESQSEVFYDDTDIGAAPASGSFKALGMVVAPCSMRSLADIAHGGASTLITRAADVALKERRRLVLMARETPLHLGHLRAMTAVTEMGGIVAPPVPSFYAKPDSIEQMVDQTVGRVLDLFDLDSPAVKRWQGLDEDDAAPGYSPM